jgi:hypothetical protein
MGKLFGPYLKKRGGLKLKKKIGLINFFWGLIIKHFGPYLLEALGDGLTGLAIGPALPTPYEIALEYSVSDLL